MNRHVLEGPWYATCTSGLGHVVVTAPPDLVDEFNGDPNWSGDYDVVCMCNPRMRGSTMEACKSLLAAAPQMRTELIKVCRECRHTSKKEQCRSCSLRAVLRKARGLEV